MHCNQAKHHDNSLTGGGVIGKIIVLTGDAILDFANVQACFLGQVKERDILPLKW